MTEKNTTGGASAAAATTATAQDAAAQDATVKQTFPYATSGEVLSNWLNRRLSEKGNVTVPLGTKRATVNRLLPDGRLECEVPDADGNTSMQQFIAFDEKMFDLLLPSLAN
jgi:hypothetical protein